MEDEIDNELVDALSVVDQLPVKHRVILALWAAGYNQRECGEIVGLSRAAVGIIRKKAISSLRKALE